MGHQESLPRAKTLSRRNMLLLGGTATVAATSLMGCGLFSGDSGGGRGSSTEGPDLDSKEAPMLAEQVEGGALPPLEERLPDNPVVVEPVDRLGVYGGEWRTALLGVADAFWVTRTVGYEALLRWTPDFTGVMPNLAESYEANEAGTEYTFTLRPALKWSDGEPFTADDIVFARNDVFNNRELYPAEPDNPAVAEKLDDYTVRISFERPEGLFLYDQAAWGGLDEVRFPFHYLKDFHKDHNPDIDQVVEQENATDWVSLFQAKAGTADVREIWRLPDLPVIYGWRPSAPLGEGQRAIVERNPYYWKVDPEGRQLPYLDRVTFELIDDAETMLLRAMRGDIDMQDRNIATPRNKPALAGSREEGNYRFFETEPTDMNTTGIAFNLTHTDPIKREIFNNKDFRIGLSYAINRQEIIDTVFQRQGQPWQMSPRPESRFHNERLATQYTEYDVAQANEYLDQAGYLAQGSGGRRLGPDGEPLSFALTFVTSWLPEWADVADLLRGYWEAVGIEVRPQSQDRSLWVDRGRANDFDCAFWAGSNGGDIDSMVRPQWFLPFDGQISPAPLWREWYRSGGEQGEAPPELMQESLSLYDQLNATPDENEQVDYMKQILENAAELFLVMGVSLSPDGYGIVKNNFHNVPEVMPRADGIFFNPAPTNPEQYFTD